MCVDAQLQSIALLWPSVVLPSDALDDSVAQILTRLLSATKKAGRRGGGVQVWDKRGQFAWLVALCLHGREEKSIIGS
jgi:hypothetical protein